MSTDQSATAPPQLSPDGHWWWDGAAWIPASQAPHAADPVVAVEPLAVVEPVAAVEPVESQKSVEAFEPTPVVDPSHSAFAALAELVADSAPSHRAPDLAGSQPVDVTAQVPVQGGAPSVEVSTGPGGPSSPSAAPGPLARSTPEPWSPQDFGSTYQPEPRGLARQSLEDGRSLGIASLVLSLVYLCGVGSLLAVVLGHVSRRRDRRAGVAPNGLALAGLSLGYVGLALLIPLLAAIAIPAFLAQRNTAATMVVSDELKRAALAQEAWAVQNGGYTRSIAELGTTGYVGDAQVSVQVIGADRAEFCLRGTSQASTSVVLYADSTTGAIGPVPCT